MKFSDFMHDLILKKGRLSYSSQAGLNFLCFSTIERLANFALRLKNGGFHPLFL